MRLSAPTLPIFIVSVMIAVLALLSLLGSIPILGTYAFWVMLLAYVLLVAGCVMKGV